MIWKCLRFHWGGQKKKDNDFRPVFVTVIPILEIWVPNFILDFILWSVTISTVDNYLEHWELRWWQSKITKTNSHSLHYVIKLRERTPWPSASSPGYKPDGIPAQGHLETGLVKAALLWEQRKQKHPWKPPRFQQQKNESINCGPFMGQNATQW